MQMHHLVRAAGIEATCDRAACVLESLIHQGLEWQRLPTIGIQAVVAAQPGGSIIMLARSYGLSTAVPGTRACHAYPPRGVRYNTVLQYTKFSTVYGHRTGVCHTDTVFDVSSCVCVHTRVLQSSAGIH
jgi:hypothetical protein